MSIQDRIEIENLISACIEAESFSGRHNARCDLISWVERYAAQQVQLALDDRPPIAYTSDGP